MMMFTDKIIVLREIGNGIMFLSALATAGIFAWYVFEHHHRLGWRDRSIVAALAIAILMVGHSFRAGPSWMEFLWLDMGRDPKAWNDTPIFFLIASALIIAGKLWVDYSFSRYDYRWWVVSVIATVSIGLPVVLHLLLGHL